MDSPEGIRVKVVSEGGVYCQWAMSLVQLVMLAVYIWKQSVGQPCLISESWAIVDGLQKFYVL